MTRWAIPAMLLVMALRLPAQEKPHPWYHDCGPGREPSLNCDVNLVDQNGRQVKLYRDLIKGKTVVIQAFFTTCKNSCPMLTRSFAALQDLIGDRLGRDVFLLSFTVDPETDTPEQLKAYAAKMKAKPGWLFLTGKKDNVDWALFKVGEYVEKKDDHLNLLMIGNEATGHWEKVMGMESAERIMQSVQRAMQSAGTGTAQ
jgi:protein SCO1/2